MALHWNLNQISRILQNTECKSKCCTVQQLETIRQICSCAAILLCRSACKAKLLADCASHHCIHVDACSGVTAEACRDHTEYVARLKLQCSGLREVAFCCDRYHPNRLDITKPAAHLETPSPPLSQRTLLTYHRATCAKLTITVNNYNAGKIIRRYLAAIYAKEAQDVQVEHSVGHQEGL